MSCYVGRSSARAASTRNRRAVSAPLNKPISPRRSAFAGERRAKRCRVQRAEIKGIPGQRDWKSLPPCYSLHKSLSTLALSYHTQRAAERAGSEKQSGGPTGRDWASSNQSVSPSLFVFCYLLTVGVLALSSSVDRACGTCVLLVELGPGKLHCPSLAV